MLEKEMKTIQQDAHMLLFSYKTYTSRSLLRVWISFFLLNRLLISLKE